VHDELFPTFDTFVKQLMSMQDEGSLDSSNLKAFQNKSPVGCYVLVVKRMKFKANLVF